MDKQTIGKLLGYLGEVKGASEIAHMLATIMEEENKTTISTNDILAAYITHITTIHILIEELNVSEEIMQTIAPLFNMDMEREVNNNA